MLMLCMFAAAVPVLLRVMFCAVLAAPTEVSGKASCVPLNVNSGEPEEVPPDDPAPDVDEPEVELETADVPDWPEPHPYRTIDAASARWRTTSPMCFLKMRIR